MIKYLYDAWGNWINKTTAAQTPIGNILISLNPFIYKGYVYDSETDLYYLKSRYYSPGVRRFVNADSEIGDVGDLENYNLFAYCMNNPVMYYDPNGNFVLTATAITALIAIGILGVIAIFEAMYHPISNAIKGASNYIASINWEERWNNFTGWVSSWFTGESETSSTALPFTFTTSWENDFGINAIENPHTKNPTPSNIPRHEKGEARTQRDQYGGEKGDKRRKQPPKKFGGKGNKWRNIKIIILLMAEEILRRHFNDER